MSHRLTWTLLGIHSTKWLLFESYILLTCSSTSLVDSLPRKFVEAVSQRPCRGSAAHIMLWGLKSYSVKSFTHNFSYSKFWREVSGANPVRKKWSRGNGVRLRVIFRRSLLSYPGNLIEAVVPPIDAAMIWLMSPYVGFCSLRVLWHISYSPSLSRTMTPSLFSMSWLIASTVL